MKITIDTEKISKKLIVLLVILGTMIAIIALFIKEYVLTSYPTLLTRTEERALSITFSKINRWQELLNSEENFLLKDFSDIFEKTSNISNIENKTRQYYKIENDLDFSIIGELIKLKKMEYLFQT